MNDTVLDRVRDGHHTLLDLVSELEPAEFRADSRLPGWSRAHVVAHLANNAIALANMTSAAGRGELVDPYPAGDRDEAIERDAAQESIALVQQLATSQAQLEIVWDSVAERDWQRPVRFRDGTVADLVLCRWRELEIHTVDLDLDHTEQHWTPEFCEHAIDFLLPRLEGAGVVLAPEELDRTWQLGDSPTRRITGSCREIACWMAGRTPRRLPDGDGPLPELGPWP
ncbi:maleylpyruvate isomerase family mycothiol-dependent enzyme [Actinopolyspora mortivallis]|uniref:maleylpyruvate isomerase family mycothiol-dependent enzyme n=1 Tax=Actinopolyspora mortivallis TaxID=33906 RepID=UPI000369ACC8|nr:maleylpyruvate isomerase family mycothiol-dependent enzyme [Actinopolyspora mortivallis]